MNSSVSVKALLTFLLALGFVAAASLAFVYYQKAAANELQAEALAKSLNDVKDQLSKSQSQLNDAKGQLNKTQSQLKDTTGKLSQEQAESQRRLSVIFAQEDNVKVLKSCLAGVATDDDYFRKGVHAFFSWVDSKSDDDYSTAVDNFRTGRGALDAVAADCSKAGDLIQ